MFPLNVYAALMRLHAGQVPFLSYGDATADDLQAALSSAVGPGTGTAPARLASLLIEAQWRRADTILSRVLPAHPARDNSAAQNTPVARHSPTVATDRPDAFAVLDYTGHLRVLEVGCGSGELSHLLARRGYDVCALDNHAAAIDTTLADRELAGSLEFVVCDFEQFEDQRGFDLLIFNNSTRYFLPLTLFYQARRLLRPGGQLLICEEFASNTAGEPEPDSLPVQNHVLALAQRMGFELLSVDDLTESSHRFQQIFLHLLGATLERLPALAKVPEPVIAELYQAVQADTLAAQQGKRRHALISLKVEPGTVIGSLAGEVYLRSAADLPADAFKNVFERSFDVEFAADLWAWKYGNGRGASVVAERNAQAIAHYGGVVRDIFYFAQSCRAVQICDVMVLPDERSFFGRSTLFFKTAASMLEQYVGYRASNLLGFGFPNIKAMHIAERLGLYEKTDELMQIALAADNSSKLLPDCRMATTDFQTVQQQADLLWAQMLPAFSNAIIGVRDAAYLHYRFVQRPGLDYECVTVSLHGAIKALLFRRPHFNGYLIMDVISAADDLPWVLQAALQPSEDGKPSVFWLTAGQLERVQRTNRNLLITKTGIQIPCNRWSRGPGTGKLAGKWWLTAGDMDFL